MRIETGQVNPFLGRLLLSDTTNTIQEGDVIDINRRFWKLVNVKQLANQRIADVIPCSNLEFLEYKSSKGGR